MVDVDLYYEKYICKKPDKNESKNSYSRKQTNTK